MMRLPAAAKMMVLPITMLWSIHTHADASIKFHAGTPVREVVSAPEFAGYGRLLFPADNRYWSGGFARFVETDMVFRNQTGVDRCGRKPSPRGRFGEAARLFRYLHRAGKTG